MCLYCSTLDYKEIESIKFIIKNKDNTKKIIYTMNELSKKSDFNNIIRYYKTCNKDTTEEKIIEALYEEAFCQFLSKRLQMKKSISKDIIKESFENVMESNDPELKELLILLKLKIKKILERKDQQDNKRDKKVKEKTIKEIYDFLRFHVKGQDDHLKKLAIVGYTQILKKNGYIKSKHKLNTLLLGGSGTGKTYILRILSEYLNLPYVIIPLTTVTEEGYDGSNIKTFLKELKASENGEYGIVFFDELDKLGEHFNNMHKRSYLLGLQNELLTLIEGQKENNIIDTHNLLFFFGGAFSSILEKNKKAEIGFISNKTDNENKALKHELRKAGIRKELISRIQNIIKLNKLTKKDLKQIVVTENGYLDFYLEFFKAFNIEVTYSKDFIEIIVDNVDKDITYGVREINDILFKFLSPFMEKASMLETNKFYHLHLTKNVVTKKILKIKEVSIVD